MSDLVVKIAGDSSEFQDSLAGLSEKVLGWVGSLSPAVSGAVGLLAGIGIAAVTTSLEYEDATNTIIAKTGASSDALKGLKTDWEAVFKADGAHDAKQIAEAISEVNVRLGLTGEPLQKAGKGFLDLADNLGLSVEPLLTATAESMTAWGLSADQTTAYQDKLLVVSQKTGANLIELTSTLAKGQPIFSQFGLSLDESANLLSTFQQSGVDGSTVIGALQKSIKTLTDAGIAPSKEAFLGMIDSIKNAGSQTESTKQSIELFGKSGASMGALIRDGKVDIDSLAEALNNSKGAVEAMDGQTDSFTEKLTGLWRSVSSLLEPLGTGLIEAGKATVDVFVEIVEGLQSGSTQFQSLLSFVQPLIDAFNTNMLPALQSVGTLLLGLGVTIIQGVLIPALQFLWNNVLSPLSSFLINVLSTSITTVFGALNSFINVLSSLPGVSSLVTAAQTAINTVLGDAKGKADDAKTSTAGLNDAHTTLSGTLTGKTVPAVASVIGQLKDKTQGTDLAKKATSDLESAESTLADALKKLVLPAVKNVGEAQEDVDTARKNLKRSTDALATSEADLKGKLANTQTSSKDLKSSMDALDIAKKAVKTSSDSLTKAEGELSASQKKNKEDVAETEKAFIALQKSMETLRISAPDLTAALGPGGLDGQIKAISASMKTAQTDAFDSQNALKSMGITPKEDLQALADKATEAFGTISTKGTASATEVRQAHIKELETIRLSYVAFGTDLPAEQQKMLDSLKTQEETFQKGSSGPGGTWENLSTQVKQTISDMTGSLMTSLFSGDGSFKEKGVEALKSLGSSVLTAFVEPANEAISGFISGTLADLMSGKGLGGVLQNVKDLGTSITGAFGGAGGSAAGAAGNIPTGGGGGGAPSGGGGAGGGTSVLGAVDVVSNVVTAGASVYQIFILENIKNCLNDMRNDTKYLSWNFDGGGLHDAFLTMKSDLSNFVNIAFGGWYYSWLTDTSTIIYEMNDRQKEIALSLDHIDTYTASMSQNIPSKLDALANTQIVVNVKNYLDSREISSVVQTDIQNKINLALS